MCCLSFDIRVGRGFFVNFSLYDRSPFPSDTANIESYGIDCLNVQITCGVILL